MQTTRPVGDAWEGYRNLTIALGASDLQIREAQRAFYAGAAEAAAAIVAGHNPRMIFAEAVEWMRSQIASSDSNSKAFVDQWLGGSGNRTS